MKADEAIEILKTWRITGGESHEALDMAIEALAKDRNVPINDCISRKAAIDALARTAREAFNLSDEYNQYLAGLMDGESAIRQLPSAQPEQQWTPSGEKPPKEGSYLVWMPFAPPKHRMAVAEYCGGYWNIKTPISAWMPLPESYRGDADE